MNIRLGKYSNILYLLLFCGLVKTFLMQIHPCAFISLLSFMKGNPQRCSPHPSFEWSLPKTGRSVFNTVEFNFKICLFTACSSSENCCTRSWKFQSLIFSRLQRNIPPKPFLICRGRLDSWSEKVNILLLMLTVSNIY